MLGLESPATYLRVGVIYILLSLPAWGMLVAGRLFAVRNPYLLLDLGSLPLGALFLWFGLGRRPLNNRSGIALRISYLSIFFVLVYGFSVLGVRLGAEALMTSVGFCAMASSYLAILTFVFLVGALFGGTPEGGEEPGGGGPEA